MKTRPKELTYLAIFLLLIAFSFPLQIIVLFGDSPLDWGAILSKLSPLNWAIIALSLTMASLLLRASPWIWAVSPAFLISVLWNNWLIAAVNGSDWDVCATAATMVVWTVHGLLLSPDSRRILTHPRQRWWRTPARKKVNVETRICPVMGGELISRTFDLSENGAFIRLEDARWLSRHFASYRNLSVGAYCSIRFNLNQTSAFSCTAEVVRQAAPVGTYPGGFAVRFVSLGGEEKKLLTNFLRGVDSATGTAAAASVA